MRFVTRLFALVGFLTVLLTVVIVAAVVHHRHTLPIVAQDSILNIMIDGELQEKPGFDPFKLDHRTSLGDVERALREAAKDSRIKGVFLNFGDNLPLAQAQELHASVQSFRQSGKLIYAFADTFGEQGPGAGEYYLAAACNKVWLQPMGMVGLMGIAADEFFLKDFLARNGLQFQVSKREQFKTAFDNFSENGFTPANRQMTESLLNDLVTQLTTSIASDRKIDQGAVRTAMDTGPIGADKAKDLNLIDEIDYRDQALDDLEDETSATDTISLHKYLGALPAVSSKNKIALIYTDGELVRHSEMDPLDPVADNQASDPRDVFNAFRQASDDDDVKAIVFRINSPGGSVIASETIRGGVLLAKDSGKPVIVSMGEMAGSGGYWIAADADRIIAEPATLTGSIGVLGGKPVAQELLKEHGVVTDSVAIGQNSNMDSLYRPLTPEQQAKQDEMLDDIYSTFKGVVSDGRKLSPEKVEDLAKGRVYTGRQAVAIGLVDELGGLETAYTRAREAAGLPASQKIELVEIPAAPTFAEFLKTLMNGEDSDDDDDLKMGGRLAIASKLKLLSALRPYLHALTTPTAEHAVMMAPGQPSRE